MSEYSPQLTDRSPTPIGDALVASISRYVAGEAISTLPDIAPGVLEAGNRRAERTYGADNVHKLLLVGPDAVMVGGQEAVQLTRNHVGEFITTLTVLRKMVPMPRRGDTTLFPYAPNQLIRKQWAIQSASWMIANLTIDDEQSILNRDSTSNEIGIPDVVVRDIRHTGLYVRELFKDQFKIADDEAQDRLDNLRQAASDSLRQTTEAPANIEEPNRLKTAKTDLSDWANQGACRDDALRKYFFSPPHNERKHEKIKRVDAARTICEDCPVKDSCLETAITRRETDGVWGGVNFADSGERRRAIGKFRRQST